MSLSVKDFMPTEASVESALAPPEALRAYMNPVEDDTWVRHADLVHMEQLRSVGNEDGLAEKRALLGSRRASTKAAASPAAATADGVLVPRASSDETATMDGMAWQEKFITEYKRQNAREDKDKALSYKQKMLENFRQKHGVAAPRPRDEM